MHILSVLPMTRMLNDSMYATQECLYEAEDKSAMVYEHMLELCDGV